MSDYFDGASSEYFEKEKVKTLKQDSKENHIKDFKIPTDKYKKTKMKIEIVEYEISN